jgi:dynein heavy chain 1, cytosolic
VPVLVQDVEKIDPVMNSVLNKEMKKVGGRLVIQVGDKEIACNGELTLFMFTRNAEAKFTPDLCSRVTFVNFTVTPSSLKSQCLNIFLKNERPDIDAQRTELLKLQGEYKEKLRQAEENLLNALNSAQGDILENDALIQQLESIKKDAAKIAEEVALTDDKIDNINEASREYDPIALMTTKIFFSLNNMANVHYLY